MSLFMNGVLNNRIFFMPYQQKKRIKSHEKGILKDPSEHYFRKTSPNHNRNNNNFDAKGYRKGMATQNMSILQSSQQQNRSKQFSFLRFIPSTTKNMASVHQQREYRVQTTKQIKIPSFFKKTFKKKDPQEHHFNQNILEGQQLPFDSRQDLRQVSSMQQSTNSNNETQNSTSTSAQLSEYKKLNDKINYLQSKISGMKGILDKKRQEKLSFMKMQKTERLSTIASDEDTSTSNSDTPLKQFVTQVPQHKDLHAFSQNPYSPRHSVYYVSQILRAYKEQKSLAREHVITSIEYLRMFEQSRIPNESVVEHLKVNLPILKGYEDKKTVIFDLDETLIHCNQNFYLPSDLKIKINFPTGELIQVGINIRPYAKQILAALSKKFEIIVFTASHSCYANVVLDHLDPDKKHIHHRLFRESCYCTPEGVYVKDLRILNRDLSKVVLVDNAAYSYAYQPLNGVPIIPYYDGKNDYELPALQKYIESLIFSYDVREKNKQIFKLDRYSEFETLNSLVQTLYSNNQ